MAVVMMMLKMMVVVAVVVMVTSWEGQKHQAARKGRPEKKDIWKLSKFSWKDGWHGAGSNVNQKCNIPSDMARTYLFSLETGLQFSAWQTTQIPQDPSLSSDNLWSAWPWFWGWHSGWRSCRETKFTSPNPPWNDKKFAPQNWCERKTFFIAFLSLEKG